MNFLVGIALYKCKFIIIIIISSEKFSSFNGNLAHAQQISQLLRKRQKSQDSRIKTLFAEIFNFKSYFCKLCMVTVNDIVGKLLKAKYK